MAPNPINALIVMVDIERFGERPDVVQAELRRSMYEIIGAAMAEIGVDWGGCHREDRGDGVIVLLPGTGPVAVLGALVREVDVALRERARSHTPLYAIRLRMVVHTGFIWHDGAGWVGTAVNLAARLIDAEPSRAALRVNPDARMMLIVSDELYRGVVAQGHPSIDARSFREVRVQAKETDTRAWIRVPGVAGHAAPEHPGSRPGGPIGQIGQIGPIKQGGLPVALTPLVGRRAEGDRVGRLLETARLVTLVGPSGIGKTRLAIAVATAISGRFDDGVVFVSLAQTTEPDEVILAIAEALRIREVPGQPLIDVVVRQLADAAMLLVVDNFEQVVEAAPTIATVLAGAPRVSVLVTSRERLAVYGEHVYRVPPLALPDFAALPAAPDPDRVAQALVQSPAVSLFEQRARAADPDFELTVADLPTVVELCRRLDGLPLAIELAAARVDRWRPAELLERFTGHLDVSGRGLRDRPARQQTLRGAIDWSYALLTAAERDLFEILAVFVGGATPAAVGAVAADLGEIDDHLGLLVDKSLLVVAADPDGAERYRMLETIRVYAADRLAGRPDAAAVHDRHTRYFLTFAAGCGDGMLGPGQAEWTRRVERDYGNLRGALAWSLDQGDTATAARICRGLWCYWRTGRNLTEGRQWLAVILSAPAGIDRTLHAQILHAAAILAVGQDDHDAARRLARQSLRLATEVGDRVTMAHSHNALGIAATEAGGHDLAIDHFRQSLMIFQELDQPQGAAIALGNLTKIALRVGDLATADAYTRRCLALERATGDTRGIGMALEAIGQIRLAQGDTAAARAALQESLSLSRTLRDVFGEAMAMHWLGLAAMVAGKHREALRLLVGALALRHEVGDRENLAISLDRVAGLVAPTDPELAARLLTAADELRQHHRLPVPPENETGRAATIEQIHHRLDERTQAAARVAGQAVPMDRLVHELQHLVPAG